jgi:hypothetical protein
MVEWREDDSESFLSHEVLTHEALTHEDNFTSMITSSFNKLFGGVSDITFFNQFVLRVHDGDRRKSDKPDLIGARISNGIPISCFLVSDGKNCELVKGKYQVQAYGLSLESFNVFLGLTLTKSNICLQKHSLKHSYLR